MSDAVGKAKGGKAVNAKRTLEERKALSAKMVEAKRELAKLPVATHSGILKISDMEFPCAVLVDGTRVLTETSFMKVMDIYRSGALSTRRDEAEEGSARMPLYLAFKNLKPFVDKHLGSVHVQPMKFKTQEGNVAHGIPAEIIPKICDVWLDARQANVLGPRQKQIAERAELLIRALAHVGITALVDEATGYQKDRARDELAKILEAFVAKELQPYLKTFPADYYAELFRLYNLPYPPEGNRSWRPAFFGHVTNDVVYKRLAPELLPELKKAASKAERKAKLHQWLTSEVGHPKLREHLASVTSILKLSRTKDDFKNNLNRIHPAYGESGILDLDDPNEIDVGHAAA